MVPAVTAPASQVRSIWVKTTLATKTMAEISIMRAQEQRSVEVARRIVQRSCATWRPPECHRQPAGLPGPWRRTTSRPRRRPSGRRRPPGRTRWPAGTSRWSHRDVRAVRALVRPGAKNLVLQAEHLGLLRRLGVVEAEQVQQPVHQQVLRLLCRAPTVLAGLPLRHRRAEHDVTEEALRRLLVVIRRAQLIHRERQHVCWAGSSMYFSW